MSDAKTPHIDPPPPTFVRYMEKSRVYYLAEGHPVPYRWAHFDDVPFTPLTKPLWESRIGLVTTAMLHGAAPHLPWRQLATGPPRRELEASLRRSLGFDPPLPLHRRPQLGQRRDAHRRSRRARTARSQSLARLGQHRLHGR